MEENQFLWAVEESLRKVGDVIAHALGVQEVIDELGEAVKQATQGQVEVYLMLRSIKGQPQAKVEGPNALREGTPFSLRIRPSDSRVGSDHLGKDLINFHPDGLHGIHISRPGHPPTLLKTKAELVSYLLDFAETSEFGVELRKMIESTHNTM